MKGGAGVSLSVKLFVYCVYIYFAPHAEYSLRSDAHQRRPGRDVGVTWVHLGLNNLLTYLRRPGRDVGALGGDVGVVGGDEDVEEEAAVGVRGHVAALRPAHARQHGLHKLRLVGVEADEHGGAGALLELLRELLNLLHDALDQTLRRHPCRLGAVDGARLEAVHWSQYSETFTLNID